jgi:enoyl-CoA hydratase/carnithine racemase
MASRSARHDRDLWWELLNHRCLTIALMHGYCYGAGLELPLLCDVRIAEAGAQFALPEVTLGYIPSACGTQMLPRLVPQGVAMHMILTGEPIGTEEAVRWGLVDEVVEAGGLDAALERTLSRAGREHLSARRRAIVTLAEIPDATRRGGESR